MKKLMMTILSLIAAFAFAVSAIAAPSPSGKWPYMPDEVIWATDENGNVVDIIIKEIDLDGMDAAIREEINNILGGNFNNIPGLDGSMFEGYSVKGMFELFLRENGEIVENANGTYDITLHVPNFKADGDYKVIHRKNNGVWENVELTNLMDEQFTGKFHTLSPVIIFEKDVEAPSAGPGEDGPNDSPDTGDKSPIALYGLAMLAAVVGIVAIGTSMKKEEK